MCGGEEKCWGRCGKVLWGVVKNEGRCGEVWESVLGWGGEVRESVGMWGSVGEGVKKCGGMWKRCGGVETKCWERCKKVCRGRCAKVLWGVGKGEGR